MSLAWETTPDDVVTVLQRHKRHVSDEEVNEIAFNLDTARIEKAVLFYTEMDDQVASAYDEIEDQLRVMGAIPASAKKRFHAP